MTLHWEAESRSHYILVDDQGNVWAGIRAVDDTAADKKNYDWIVTAGTPRRDHGPYGYELAKKTALTLARGERDTEHIAIARETLKYGVELWAMVETKRQKALGRIADEFEALGHGGN